MRVLVTGAQGCIGSWCVKSLLERGLDVLAYDKNPNPTRLSHLVPASEIAKVRFVEGQIEDTARVKGLMKDEGITHVIHLAAALMPFCQANPVTGGMIDMIGTLNVFEGARDAGREVRVVYASSSAVWGPEDSFEKRSLNEQDSLFAGTHYGVFKMANEGNARVFYSSNGISSVGVRPWTVYGVGRDSGLTAGTTLAMKAVVKGEPYQMGVTGHMDLQYVADVAEIFNRCLLDSFTGAHVFNLAGDIIRVDQFIQKLEAMRPGAAKLITSAGSEIPVAYQMDGAALAKMIPGLKRTPLEEGMQETLAIYDRLLSEGKL